MGVRDRIRRVLAGVIGVSAIALSAPPPPPTQASTPESCPTELEPLVNQLMLDLPAYANRVIQRQSFAPRPEEGFALRSPQIYMLLAGQPQINPLVNPVSGGAPLYQIFFTTLERQYLRQQPFDEAPNRNDPQEFQQFHQLVLAQIKAPSDSALSGSAPSEPALSAPPPSDPPPWRVIRLRSQLAPYPAENQRLSPPRNADQSPTAQAIRLWLRDCFRRNAPAKR